MSSNKLIAPIAAFVLCVFITACGTKEATISEKNSNFEQIFIFDSIKTVYSENSKVMMERDVVKLITKENGDEVYPKGIVIRKFDNGTLAATIVADSGYYDKSKEKMRLRGSVKVVNIEKGETLETPLLNWERGKKEIYTDTTVTISAEGAVTYGKGLTAKQDFSSYELSEISSSPDAFEEKPATNKPDQKTKSKPLKETVEEEDLNFDF